MKSIRGLGLNSLLNVVFPLSIVHGTCSMDISFQFSPFIFGYCLILGIFAAVDDSLWGWRELTEEKWSPGFTVDILSYLLSSIIWLVILVEMFRQRRDLERVIRELSEVDSFLNHPKYVASFYLIPLALAMFALFSETVVIAIEFDSFFTGLGYYLYISPLITFSSQYFFLLAIVTDQLSHLNLRLTSSSKSWNLKNLITIHKCLCDTAGRINNIFDVHLLIITSVPFIINTMKIYTTVLCITKPDQHENSWLLAENVLYLSMNLVVTWCLIHSSSNVRDKAKEFNSELIKVVLTHENMDDLGGIQQYLYMKWTVTPTACGFYNIDYSLLTSMFAGYFTFVIYIIQLSDSSLRM